MRCTEGQDLGCHSSTHHHRLAPLFKALSCLLLSQLLLVSPASPLASLSRAPNYGVERRPSCLFPEKWEGEWFQSGVRQPIQISQDKFSTKGRCIASDGDKFLIHEEKTSCHRCVVIHEKHDNVLQYKETYCTGTGNLFSICSHITGDALLYSMFRVNAVPIGCPFPGYHTFSYDRGHGECRSPPSTMESCTQESKLILKYQACPDVYGSESAVEELECLGMWKEGSSRYLVGKVEHSHVSSDEDRYRCFVYEKVGGGVGPGGGGSLGPGPLSAGMDSDVVYRVAQSGDATCNGLFSPMEGSRTMTLHRGANMPKCKFPAWISLSSHWHSLDYKLTYSLHHRNQSLRVSRPGSGGEPPSDVRLHCTQLKAPAQDSVTILVHYVTGCQSGFMCMVFYRRDQHVIELQEGQRTRRAEDACAQGNFDKAKAPFITLVTSNPEEHKCPQVGRFSVTGMVLRERERRSLEERSALEGGRSIGGDSAIVDTSHCSRTVVIGCGEEKSMEFRSLCPPPATNIISVYHCHAGWSENGTHYLITTPELRQWASGGVRRYCFIYRPDDGGSYQFSTSPETCRRTVKPGITGTLTFNISHLGLCAEVSNSAKANLFSLYLLTLLLFTSFLLSR